MVPTNNDTGCFGAFMAFGPHCVQWELYIIPVDYPNKKIKEEEWKSGRQKAEAELHGERKTFVEKGKSERQKDSELKRNQDLTSSMGKARKKKNHYMPG